MKKNIVVFITSMLFFWIINSSFVSANESANIYNGQLGYSYSNSSTEFKIWSSSASEIEVVVEGNVNKVQAMERDEETNVWIAFVGGDLSGCEYSYNIRYEDGTSYSNVLDPYGKYLNVEENRNMIFGDNLVSFENWYNIEKFLNIDDNRKIIYGINLPSFTSSSSWNGSEINRGKILSLSQTGTRYNNVVTGYDHIKNLGVTYIELSDMENSYSPFAMNWDYVSGDYGYSGTLEFRQVVSSYYSSNIGVIVNFDISSMVEKIKETLIKIDKEYYLQENNKMIEKYVKDVLVYWVEKYKLSGVSFQNMGALNVNFMNEISALLKNINENILIYGDGSYSELDNTKAGENNLTNLESIRMANSSLNYGLLGELNEREGKGVLAGNYSENIVETLKFSLLSSVDNGEIDYSKVEGVSYKGYWGNKSSYQLVNYLGAREGLSIYDKLIINNLTGGDIIEQKLILAFGTLMVSGGVPYIEAGSEFLVSYQNFNDTADSICTSTEAFCFYSVSDKKIIDWSFAYENSSITDSFKSLVNFRKGDSMFIQSSSDVIKNVVNIYDDNDGTIGYVRTYPNAYVNETQKVLVIFNYSNEEYAVNGFSGKGWSGSYQYNLAGRDGKVINMKPYSIYMESKIRPPKVNQWVLLILVLGVIGLLYSFNIIMNKKLVETKGYDIKDISRKYRPFINKNNINKKQNDEVDYSEREDKSDEEK